MNNDANFPRQALILIDKIRLRNDKAFLYISRGEVEYTRQLYVEPVHTSGKQTRRPNDLAVGKSIELRDYEVSRQTQIQHGDNHLEDARALRAISLSSNYCRALEETPGGVEREKAGGVLICRGLRVSCYVGKKQRHIRTWDDWRRKENQMRRFTRLTNGVLEEARIPRIRHGWPARTGLVRALTLTALGPDTMVRRSNPPRRPPSGALAGFFLGHER